MYLNGWRHISRISNAEKWEKGNFFENPNSVIRKLESIPIGTQYRKTERSVSGVIYDYDIYCGRKRNIKKKIVHKVPYVNVGSGYKKWKIPHLGWDVFIPVPTVHSLLYRMYLSGRQLSVSFFSLLFFSKKASTVAVFRM